MRKYLSIILIGLLVSIGTVGGPSVLAGTPSNTDTPGSPSTTGPVLPTPARKETKPDGKLRADFTQLVSDAKAGKVAPAGRPQIQTVRRNNLSDGAKIAIGVGIVVAVVVLLVTHKRGRTYDRDLGCTIAGTC